MSDRRTSPDNSYQNLTKCFSVSIIIFFDISDTRTNMVGLRLYSEIWKNESITDGPSDRIWVNQHTRNTRSKCTELSQWIILARIKEFSKNCLFFAHEPKFLRIRNFDKILESSPSPAISWIPEESHDSFPGDIGCFLEIEAIIGWLSALDFNSYFSHCWRFAILKWFWSRRQRGFQKHWWSNHGQLELLRNAFYLFWSYYETIFLFILK